MDMVERVARAILAGHDWTTDHEPREVTGWDALPPDWQDAYRGMARAAIEAMRNPTKRMRMAACAAMSPGKRPTQKVVSNPAKHAIRYRAMIDAALSPAPSNTPTVDHANHTGSAE
jgi:hypothetical protein